MKQLKKNLWSSSTLIKSVSKINFRLFSKNVTDNQIWIQLGSLIDDISISPEFAKDIADALNQVETKAHSTTKKQIEQFKLLEFDPQSKEVRLMDMRISGEIDRFNNKAY